jgi:inner membrane transporter RhtA
VIGVIVLAQLPSLSELLGVGLIVAAVAIHRDRSNAATPPPTGTAPAATRLSRELRDLPRSADKR